MKKVFCTVLAFLFIITGCATKPTEQTPTQASLKAGTYQASAIGFHGELQVEVVVDESKIQSVQILEHVETPFISDNAIQQLPKDIVEQQSLTVDTYSGCTVSSRAVLSAVENALQSAGELSSLKKEPVQKQLVDETKDTDVLVIGGGMAGFAAAISAKEEGANVILVEKLDRVGGSTVESGGIFYATNTSINNQQDHDVQALVDYWQTRAEGHADEKMLTIAAEGSSTTLAKMQQWGVLFSNNVTASGISPALRAHYATNAQAEGKATDGVDFIVPLLQHAQNLGIEILTGTEATKLIMKDGLVSGVVAVSDEKNYTIHAKSVVIASGGYDLNKEMMKQHSPEMADTWAISSPGNTGDGITMAQEVGAATDYTGGVIGFKIIDVSRHYIEGANTLGWTGQLGVTNQGTRFGNEAADYPIFCTNLIQAKQAGAEKFYLVIDSTTEFIAQLAQEAVSKNNGFTANSLEELAKVANIDATNLAETVATYNNHAQGKESDEFGKTNLVAVDKAPYYAIEIKPATLGTIGGLVLSENAEVLDEQGKAIANLYAAGEVANSQFFYKEYPASGSSISISGTFGIIAGQQAAQNSK